MKVEIDAVELCELRHQIILLEYSNKQKQKTIDISIAEIRKLSNKLTEARSKNVDYCVKVDWEKLKEERDFWRSEALTTARVFEEMALKGVSGQLLVSMPMRDRAMHHGYEVS